jgi:hypothetical protein
VITGEIAFRYSCLGIPKLRSLQGARCSQHPPLMGCDYNEPVDVVFVPVNVEFEPPCKYSGRPAG